jgi:hypothetical protein
MDDAPIRAMPAKLPDLARLQADLAQARRMEATAEDRYRGRSKKAHGGRLYRRFAAWREKRERLQAQISERIARDAAVKRIVDSLS